MDDVVASADALAGFCVGQGKRGSPADHGGMADRRRDFRPHICMSHSSSRPSIPAFVDPILAGVDGREVAATPLACGSAAHLIAATLFCGSGGIESTRPAGFDERAAQSSDVECSTWLPPRCARLTRHADAVLRGSSMKKQGRSR